MMPLRPSAVHASIFLALFAFAVALQAMSGAYQADFAGNPDEPVHYVTGVMVREYLATFPWRAPMPFARDFYDHYPAVAIGHWPPGFYVVQSMWTLPFGASRTSVLLLMALLSAAAATVVFALLRPRFGAAPAMALALTFLSAPIVREYSRMVMAELPITLLVLGAAATYRRYLDSEAWRDSLLFGVLSSAAILTKPNGLALALLPVIAVLVTRRWTLLKTFAFWLPAIAVVLVCAPWYVLTADLAQEGWSASYDPSWLLQEPATVNTSHLIRIAGAPLFALAIAGAVFELWPRWHRRFDHLSVVMASLLGSVWLFHSFVVPVRDARHLIPAIPAMLALSAAALAALARMLTSFSWVPQYAVTAFGATICFAFLIAGAGHIGVNVGAEAAVREVRTQSGPTEVVLVSSEGYGEGVFIAEMAEHQPRPTHRVVRAGKVLSNSTWNRSGYRLLHDNTAAVDRYLEAENITVIVVDLASPLSRAEVPHHRQLLEVLRGSSRWTRLSSNVPGSRFAVFLARKSDTR